MRFTFKVEGFACFSQARSGHVCGEGLILWSHMFAIERLEMFEVMAEPDDATLVGSFSSSA